MSFVVAAVLTLLLVVGATLVHYEALLRLNGALPCIRIPHRALLLVVLFGCFAAHVLEIVIYAVAYWLLADRLGLGGFGGGFRGSFDNYLYFSAETYTSLGFGDIYPLGALRLLAGFETLNGLLLIAWSASFTYLAMERFWAGSRARE